MAILALAFVGALAPSCATRTACAPTTCAAAGRSCGALPDGCGAMLDCGACGPLAPADPQASATARRVLSYLAALPDRTDKRVLSGQRAYILASDWAAITQASGRTPAILGGAYICFDLAGCAGKPIQKLPPEPLIAHFQKGGLVQMSELVGNPKTNGGCIDTSFDRADFDHLLTPGDPINLAFLAQLDTIAAGYQVLADAGVVILVHALNEMNGYWFWWSRGTPDQYKRLWQLEFDYFTKTKALHNLLFTYAPNAGTGNYAAFYPGDAYIDVVGLDYYLDVDGPIPKAGGYDELTTVVAPTKPFAFIEFGPLGGNDTVFSPRDYDQLIVAIKQSMPKVTYWHSWNQIWGMGIANPATGQSHSNVPQLLADPWVVNLGDVVLPAAAP